MIDFQIVTAQSLLPVQSVAPVRNFLPPSVVVLGTNLNQATQVLFNGVVAPDFIVITSSRLIVQIPASQVGQVFSSLQVLGDAFLSASYNMASLSFQLLNPIREISGLARLVQSWLLSFMSTPGSDIFNPSSGGGGAAIIGRNTDGQGTGVSADLAQAISRTQTELTKAQAQYPTIPLDERLLSSTLTGISFDSSTGTLFAQVSIQNMMAQSAMVTLSSATSSG